MIEELCLVSLIRFYIVEQYRTCTGLLQTVAEPWSGITLKLPDSLNYTLLKWSEIWDRIIWLTAAGPTPLHCHLPVPHINSKVHFNPTTRQLLLIQLDIQCRDVSLLFSFPYTPANFKLGGRRDLQYRQCWDLTTDLIQLLLKSVERLPPTSMGTGIDHC